MGDIIISDVPQAEQAKLDQQSHAVVTAAQELVVENDDQYASAAEFLRNIKTNIQTVVNTFAEMKRQAHNAHREVCKTENNFKDPLERGERIVRKKIQDYLTKKERERIEAERRIKDEQRRLAEAELARAEKLEESGYLEAASAALQTAVSISSMDNIPAGSGVKISGISTVKDYEVVITDAAHVPCSVMGVDIRPIDIASIKRLARATKGTISIPGVKIVEIQAVRAKAN